MISDSITSDDILGKDAIDPEGEILGVVMKLHIDRIQKRITGITIDQGFMKPDLFVGLDYVKTFGVDTVFLSKVPYDKYIGMEVVTEDGITVGRVKDIISEYNQLKGLVVRKGMGKIINIGVNQIKDIGSLVFLKGKDY